MSFRAFIAKRWANKKMTELIAVTDRSWTSPRRHGPRPSKRTSRCWKFYYFAPVQRRSQHAGQDLLKSAHHADPATRCPARQTLQQITRPASNRADRNTQSGTVAFRNTEAAVICLIRSDCMSNRIQRPTSQGRNSGTSCHTAFRHWPFYRHNGSPELFSGATDLNRIAVFGG